MPFSRISPLSSPADPPPSEPNDMRALERSEMEERGKERDALTAPLPLTVPNRRCLPPPSAAAAAVRSPSYAGTDNKNWFRGRDTAAGLPSPPLS